MGGWAAVRRHDDARDQLHPRCGEGDERRGMDGNGEELRGDITEAQRKRIGPRRHRRGGKEAGVKKEMRARKSACMFYPATILNRPDRTAYQHGWFAGYAAAQRDARKRKGAKKR